MPRAYDADPSDTDVAYNLAMLLQDKRSEAANTEAAGLYTLVVQTEPERWDAWANLVSTVSSFIL